MKQCVAPVSSGTVTRRGPCAVQRNPDSRGLNIGLLRSHAWNVGMAVKVARLACQAAAEASIESLTWSAAAAAAQAAVKASSARCGPHEGGPGPSRPERRGRGGNP